MQACKRCKRILSLKDFWYKDRNACTNCLIKGQVSSSNARARRFGQKENLSDYEWAKKLKEYNHVCALCNGNKHPIFPLEIDHIVPLSVGGSHHIDNLRPLCNFCNVSRGNGVSRAKKRLQPLE